MTIKELLKDKDMSIYKLAKTSTVPYATCRDIVSGKAKLEKCSAETVYKLSHALNVTVEELLGPCLEPRPRFENFKSTVCHRVKEMGDIDFIIYVLESQQISSYYDRQWYPESLYLLAMVDYLSRVNKVPLCEEYDNLRHCRLEKPVYPSGILAMSAAFKSDDALKKAESEAIPEFKRFNIMESEVRNVV